MRRMIDPKTIGGGGDEKLYCHCIYFTRDSNSKGGKIVVNYYSKKKDAFTYSTFNNEFSGDKRVACNGYIQDGNNYFTAFFIIKSKNDIYAYYMDTIRNVFELTGIYYYTFHDYVSEVN